jgi:hypothetical protein
MDLLVILCLIAGLFSFLGSIGLVAFYGDEFWGNVFKRPNWSRANFFADDVKVSNHFLMFYTPRIFLICFAVLFSIYALNIFIK